MARRQRQALIGSLVGALVLSGVVVGVNAAGAPGAPLAAGGDGEMPGTGGVHMDAMHRAIPGDSGMSPEGPGNYADDAFEARAYPGDTISIEQIDTAKAAFLEVAARQGDGTAAVSDWESVGPSRALYPFTPLRDAFSYVPNEYVAGGRTTAMAISNVCDAGDCRAWITPAGGGVWGTEDVLAAKPSWTYMGGPLGINAAGSVTIDPNDANGDTIYVGTGEGNTCGSGCVAGVGIYKSTDAGATWTGPIGKDDLGGKGIGRIAVVPGSPNTIYAATTTALRGLSSVCCSGVTRPVPDAAQWGLYKSVDGGGTWSFIHNGTDDLSECDGSAEEYANTKPCSPRGVRWIELDPNDADTVYASSYARGIWRSTDAGDTWSQVKESLNSAVITTRAAFDVVALENGDTRMYVMEGNTGTPYARAFRSDDVATGNPTFQDLTSSSVADPGYATYNLCGGQCWYDVFVTAPEGHPDMVYFGGSYAYGETIANKRGVVFSQDAGVSATDMTYDGTDETHPNGIHPDQHSLVVNPNNPLQFFETGDGGVVRSNGELVDRSDWCDDPRRSLSGPGLERCQQMLSAIPELIEGINEGLSTLQFMSLSVSPHEADTLQGGTQDNGTWENKGQVEEWVNTMIGDGGQSGFDAENPDFRFHTFYDATPEVNFSNGETSEWISIYDQIFGHAGTQFYAPIITDPVVSGTMFAGTGQSVYRTKTHGLGDRSLEEANRICNSWTGTFEAPCGDWEQLGDTWLTDAEWGDRAGGAVSAIERNPKNERIAWAATTTGRLFVTRNVDAEPASAVEWQRVDDDTVTPNRFISSIYPHPQYANRAFVSYSGFESNTPDTPGHVFRVRLDPERGTADWRDLSFDLGDQPISDLVRDTVSKDLYASTDFGVLRRDFATATWVLGAPGMPNVEVPGLTIDHERGLMYAASHGLGAWRLSLE